MDQYWYVKHEATVIAAYLQFRALEDFMEDRWDGKRRCGELYVDEEVLDVLEEAATSKSFQSRSGFFFNITAEGARYRSNRKTLLEKVIPSARKYLKEGKTVIYKSSFKLGQVWEIKRDEDIAHQKDFNALEGFMREKWFEQGNTDEIGGEELFVDKKIIDELEQTILDGQLEPVTRVISEHLCLSGLYLGSLEKDEKYEADVERLLGETIPKIRNFLNEGERVFYTSCW